MEKPALGRGLDALMSGGKGADSKKASDLLAFQGKRTRVGKGLGAFIKGGQTSAPPATAPTAPTAPPSSPKEKRPPSTADSAKPLADLNSMRARRRPAAAPPPQPASPPNYRRARRPRTSAAQSSNPTGPEKSEPAPARLFVGSTNAPTTAKPFSAVSPAPRPNPTPDSEPPKKPKIIRPKKAAPVTAPKPRGNPGFRLSLFAVDWFLLALAFYVALNIEAGSHVALTLCALAVLLGAALGVWGLILETEEGDD